MADQVGMRTMAMFNVRDFGATGVKDDNAQTAIQQAIDACAAAGGGMVYFPPGAYTSGTIHLRSHVRIFVEAGATLYSSKDPAHFDQRSLFYADGVENITLEGRGTIDGQAEHEWRLHDIKDWYIYPNQLLAEKAGMPLMRSFPTANSVGHLILFIRCKDVHISGLSFLHSTIWTMHLFGCERVVIDGVYIYTSLEEGVWSDGIDPDGCKDVHISNCTIETGDDALVFYSSNIYGPAQPCENITVTNCRLSSASSALKFCDGNMNAIRNVTIENCVITGSNRGIAFMVFDGGVLENVVLSNLTIECKPFDWFWWGDGDPIHFNLIQRSEIDPNIDKAKEPPIGAMRNILLRNVFARGTGACRLHGRPDARLENVTLENVRLVLTDTPQSPLQKGEHALVLENARHFRLKNVEIVWELAQPERWHSAMVLENVEDLTLSEVSARQAADSADAPAIVLNNINGALVRDCHAQVGTGLFLHLTGEKTQDITLRDNDTRAAREAVRQADEVPAGAVQAPSTLPA